MEVTSQFLYRGTYTDYENTFQRRVETPVEVHLSSTKDVAVLRSKEWFHLNDSYDVDLLNKTLTFQLSSSVRYKNQTAFSSVETMGQVLLELGDPSGHRRQQYGTIPQTTDPNGTQYH